MRTSVAPSTTWWLVSTIPSRITTPEPIPRRSRSGGSCPKNRLQKSRISGGTSASLARSVLTPTTVPRTRSTRGASERSVSGAGGPTGAWVFWRRTVKSRVSAAAPTERMPIGSQAGRAGMEGNCAAPSRSASPCPISACASDHPGVEDVTEDERSDDGRVRFDDEPRRVHVELAPGDLLVWCAAAVRAVGGRAVGDLAVVRPVRRLLQPEVELEQRDDAEGEVAGD